MTLILRKCWSDSSSSNGFKYGQVGDIVTAPDWNVDTCCGNGLHGLKEGNGEWLLLQGTDWLVIEANDEDIVDIDQDKCKFRKGKILFRGTTEQLSNSEFPNKFKLNSNSAYYWARKIGNHDIMIDKITDSVDAYYWAYYIGNKDIMMNKITDPELACSWAYEIGDHDIMLHKFINNSESAFYWALNMGSNDIMKLKVTEDKWIDEWNLAFPEDKIER